MKKALLIVNIIGILVGIVCIIIGFGIVSDCYTYSWQTSNIKFGADFYTEIYKVCEQIWAKSTGIVNGIQNVIKNTGIAFIIFGILDILVFAKKVIVEYASEPDKKGALKNVTADGEGDSNSNEI